MKQNVSKTQYVWNRFNIAPEPDEIEVSIFGPGYGESVLLHVGQNKWFIVDSCIEPISEEPAPLTYLRKINVDPATSVKQVIATHWHDDHIRGLGNIVKTCISAEFVCSDALKLNEFLYIVSAYGVRTMMQNSGIGEFRKILEILEERMKLLKSRYLPIKWAIENRCLWKDYPGSSNCSIYSLSPSDASVLAAKLDFSRLLPQEKESKKRLISITPNRSAVVLWVTIGDVIILLGSDLEEEGDPKTGWSVIVNTSSRPEGKASLFKIPHHGSKNAHHGSVWTEMLEDKPVAVVTPYENGKTTLPSKTDVERICSLTDKGYATAINKGGKTTRDRTVEKTIRETVRYIKQLHTSIGHVRVRVKPSNPWTVELFGDALPLNRLYTS